MRTRLSLKLMSCAGVTTLALAAVSGAAAQCGLPNKLIKPSSWQPQLEGAHPSMVRAALDTDEAPAIVGMWHVIFTAETQNGQAVPGGVVIDNSVVVWHSDGTEIMNSSRSAQDGNFCLGIWKQTGQRTYVLNHIPWRGNVFDPAAPPDTVGPPQAGVQIIEKITVTPDGNSYSGTFTLNAYDASGKVYVSFSGVLSAIRITVETPFSDLL